MNGNGRTMALKSVYKGKPKQIKAYKDFLKQNAKSLGINPATIDGVKNPVLVRQVADDAPVQDIINSKAGGLQMSAGKTAKKDADRIKQATLQLASDSGDLTQESNRKFVNSVLKDVASPEELNTLYTKTGKISQAGITRVKNAVFAKAYGDDYLLTKMSESTDNNIRNVMNAMLTVAPKVAMLNDGMGKGLFYSYPLSDVISGSAKTLIGLREQNKPVKFYLEETSLITESENQNSINDVLQFIDNNKRSGKTITAFFNEMCNEIELQGHPGQSALIASENPTMEEVINIAEGKVENNGVQSLFDTGRSEGNQTDTTSGRMADGVLPGTSAGTETNAGINGSERQEESAGKTESRPEVAKQSAHETDKGHPPIDANRSQHESIKTPEYDKGQKQHKVGKGEANEESIESNHVNTEPQQAESKNTESTHAEEGSESDVQEEIAHGKKAMAVVLQTKRDVKAAMHRDDVGDIDFIYGTPGKESKFKKGYGIAHIKAKRDSENGSGIDTLNKLVEVIAKGTDTEIQHANGSNGEYRLKIHYDGYTAILSSKTEKANSWLLTGWEDKKEAPVSARSEGYDSSTATTATPTLTRRSRETGTSSTSIIPQEAEKGKKYSVREENAQLIRSKEGLKAEIKEAFPNAKEIKDEGERMTFTMPNGSHIVVDLKNEILLTDKELAQAKKDHHIDDNGNVVVEGYAEVHGKDAYMALAQGSREGTGFHEAYHLAEGAVLTDREKTAIKKAIPDAEKRADKYAEWVEARKRGRGTAWGKLFQKIKDFAMKMKTILTGAENVHNVFRKIESGEVWERTPTNGQTGKYSLNRKKLHDAIRRWNNLCDYYEKSDKQLWKKKHNGDLYKLMDMPLILEAISNQNMELSVYGSFFGHALKEEHHGMTLDIIRQLPAAMAEPMMILQSRNGKNKFVFVLDVKDLDGATVIVPVELEKIDKNHGIINVANSAYGKTRRDGIIPNDEWFIKNIDEGNLLYVDTKKSVAHGPSGAYSPVGSAVIHALSKSIIKTEKDLVNLQNQHPTRYSVTKPKDVAEEVREKAEQDAENTVVTLNDILTEARKIVPIYTKSKVGEKSPAKYHYDARQRAGFVPESFDVGDIGSAIALHIDSIGEIKGANIELTKDIIEDRQMEQRNAKKYKSKVPTDISPSQARQEGVRNFGRLYFLDNERAKETYPQYYDLFEKALDGMPKEKAGVEKVLALQDQRVRQNPLLSAAAGISNGKPDSQLTWKERMKKRLLHLYAKMVDETDPIGQLTKALELETGAKIADEKDPHKRALMCNSVASARAFMLLDGDNRVANLKALNKVYKGAIKNKIRAGDLSIRHLVSNLYLVVVAGLSSIRLTP
ncbi:hypothetical protein AT798_00540 [Megasphaera sp. DJF_B143]|nr:hypothetical protein AT798_00540 [Megasphaera sp. DJF_B143]